MYILSLRANKETFKPINFNKTGISIICGSKCDTEDSEILKRDRTKTYNGVGKSLMIRLIDFCLGSNAISDFKNNLSGWEFILDVEINEEKKTIVRKTDNQEKVYIDGEEYDLEKFNSWLDNRTFLANIEEVKYLTFRSLITRFIRPTKSSYESYKKTFSRETEFQSLINEGFLLGLNPEIIYEKYSLKKKLDTEKTTLNTISSSETFKKNISKIKDIPLEISRIRSKIQLLDDDLSKFKIGENYNKIEEELIGLEKEKQQILNQLFSINRQLDNIKENLKVKIAVEDTEVFELYKIAQIQLTEMVKKNINEVNYFHKRLIENRHIRLKEEKKKLLKDKKEQEDKLLKIDESINLDYKYLDGHGALSQYDSIQRELSENKVKLSKITELQKLLSESEENITKLKANLATEESKAITYINEKEDYISCLNEEFLKISGKLYPDKASGITIRNNTGDNQIRFDLDVEIDDDESDGINSAKILAYDFVKLMKVIPKINFLIHDGRLFNHMDPNQIATILEVLNEKSKEIGFQYIMTINENILSDVVEVLEDEENEFLLDDKTIVRKLLDDSPESKLLGINVKLKYQ